MTLLPAEPSRRRTAPDTSAGDFGDLFRFTGAVGPEAANARDDIIRAQILLGQTGDLDLDSLGGPTGWPGGELTRGLRRYQRRKGLTVDGLMLPDGETITALQDELYDRLAVYKAPTTGEVDAHHDRLALARYPSEAREMPRTALVKPGEDAPAYVQRSSDVRSDIDPDHSLNFTPGAQIAQALPILNPATGAVGIAGASQQPYGVTPEAVKAGQQLEKWFDEKVNLLSLPAQLYQALTNGTSSAASSQSLDPEIEAASKTPPLKPDTRMPSIPPSMKQEDLIEIEEFIRHEGKDWIEGFSALDQKFIRDLMIQQIHHHGMLGKPETRETDLKIAKMMTEIRNKEYPELVGLFNHLYGSYHEGNKDDPKGLLKQEFVKRHSRMRHFPDITFGHPDDEEVRGRINTVTGKVKEIAPGFSYFKPTKGEQTDFNFMTETMEQIVGGVAQMVPKTWTLNDDAEWEQHARTACRMILEGIKTKLHEKGYLKQADERPALPEPGKP